MFVGNIRRVLCFPFTADGLFYIFKKIGAADCNIARVLASKNRMSERKDRDEERKKRMKGKETRGRGWVGERNREGKAGRKKKEARM